MDASVLWLVRYGHVAAGAAWVGGYVVLAFILLPALQRDRSPVFVSVVLVVIRLLTYVGTATIVFGVLLIMRTRGFDRLLHGEWGILILLGVVIAVALLGIGDSALRPGVRKLAAGGDGAGAQRAAVLGAVLSIIAIGVMTRALYAPG